MDKVGIVRGPSLNPYEGQFFEKLGKFGFQPVGIATFDSHYIPSEIRFPVRTGHNYSTLTNGKFRYMLHVLARVSKYDFRALNYCFFDLKELTADLNVLHSADTWYPYTYQAIKTKIPTVVTEWENIPFNYERLPFSKIKRYCNANAAHFVAITEKTKQILLMEGVSTDRISVIPAGVDCGRFKPAPKDLTLLSKYGIPNDTLNILFVGRLIPEKGVFTLLEAFALLLKNYPYLRLLFVGSGHPKIKAQIIHRINELKIGSKTKFLGGIPYSSMPQIHNLADAFCLPSIETKDWAEQFGYSMVEAMACGKPVVSTLSGSIPEIVKNKVAGLLVNQKDSEALRMALETFLADEKTRARFGRAAREWVLQKFEANKVAKQLADVYRTIA